jgi:hypothetical protein
MRIDFVDKIPIFVLEKNSKVEKMKYKTWISVGDFFHLILSEVTPMATYQEITQSPIETCNTTTITESEKNSQKTNEDTTSIGGEKQNPDDAIGLLMNMKMIPLVVGLKIVQEINVNKTSNRAEKIISMFQPYLKYHDEEMEADYDTEPYTDTEDEREEKGKEKEKIQNK